jgi:hypothetical protein
MITPQEQMLLAIQYPYFAELSIEEIDNIINDYKEWLVEDLEWLAERGGDANTLEFLQLYFDCLTEDNDFILEQMAMYGDDDDED